MARSRRRKSQSPAPVRRAGRCVAIGAKGDGVIELETGAEAFAPYAAPGDEGAFDVVGDRAAIAELSVYGPQRVDPPCPQYGRCGGCALQHMSPAFQRDWKRDRVVEALRRAGLDAPVEDTVATPAATRRRATFAVFKSGGRTVVGFNERRSSAIVPVDGCVVLRPDFAERLPDLERLAAAVPAPAFDLVVTAADNGLDVDIRSRRLRDPDHATLRDLSTNASEAAFARVSLNGEPLLVKETPIVRFGTVPVAPPPGAFLQVSAEGEAAIAEAVLRAVDGARRVADLHAGCGTFALRLAAAGASVYAADADKAGVDALRDAAAAARRMGSAMGEVTAEVRNLDDRPLQPDELARFDAVVFDPPRAGAKALAEALASSSVRTVVGVSCNPATFARDAALLTEGGYALTQVTPIDQFVYASHVELVGVFRR
ncbi:MAG: hypothetical protein AAFX08_07510 [Pseudomonadota bacterium]